MATLNNLDNIIAGFQPPITYFKVGITMEAAGVHYSPFYRAGMPGAAVAPTPGLGGAHLTSYSGQIPFTNPSTANETKLAKFILSSSQAGSWVLCDRLWHNSSIVSTTTTAQTVNSGTWEPRDRNGGTDGDGIMVGIEVSTPTTNGSAVTNTTMSYDESVSGSTHTATITSFPASATLGTFVPFELAAGDRGVREVNSITLGTSYGTGVVHLVAYRVLARGYINIGQSGYDVNIFTSGGIRLYDNTVPFLLWLPSATTATTLHGQLIVAQG